MSKESRNALFVVVVGPARRHAGRPGLLRREVMKKNQIKMLSDGHADENATNRRTRAGSNHMAGLAARAG
jgi:hypothetical protein